jgi:arsenate reductase
MDLVRKNEKEWKENFKGREMSEEEVVTAMIAHPKLIERPIVISGDRAVVGRPPENINQLLN